jgi:ParB-like chromosome segregation protein Spo0J
MAGNQGRKQMKIETIQIKDLKLDPDNARKHDNANLKAISGSLSLFGQRKPIVISQNGTVVAGNGTLTAAKSLGWSEIEAVRIPSDWDANKIKAFALADNRTAELAAWDQDVMASQLLDLEDAGFEIADFGFVKTEPVEKILDTNEMDWEERFEVIIECDNEIQQQELLNRFTKEGYKVRALVV